LLRASCDPLQLALSVGSCAGAGRHEGAWLRCRAEGRSTQYSGPFRGPVAQLLEEARCFSEALHAVYRGLDELLQAIDPRIDAGVLIAATEWALTPTGAALAQSLAQRVTATQGRRQQ
jgi:hypothetical protein